MATLAKVTGKGRGLVLTGLGVSLALGLVVVAALTIMLPLGAPTSKTGSVSVPVAQVSQLAAATVPTTTTNTTSVPASSPTATLTATTSPLSSVSPLTSAVLPANSIDPANIISPTATPASAGEATAQAATASASTPAPQAAGATTTPSQQSQPPSQGDTLSLSAGTQAGTGTGQANPLVAAVPPALPLVLANPVKLSIPAISLTDKPVKLVEPETVRLRDGSTVRQWAVPDAAIGVHDSKTGQVCKWGLTALVAHNYWPTAYQAALFVNLGKLKPGDTIQITDDGGTSCQYTVEENRVVNLTEGGKLLSDQGKIADLTRNHLLLYTCTPQFNDNRQMVTAVQVVPPKP